MMAATGRGLLRAVLIFSLLCQMFPGAVWPEYKSPAPNKIEPRAYILKGTLLYLYRPQRSKYLHVNSLGFRGGKVKKKSKNAFRIAVMGGSTVFGMWQADFQTIPFFLEKILQQKYPDRKVEVLNMGIVGYTIQRETALISHLLADVRPDLVIYCHGWNDMSMAYHIDYADLVPFDEEDETFFVKRQKEANSQPPIAGLAGRIWEKIAGQRWWERRRDLNHRRELFVQGYLKHLNNARERLQWDSIPVLFAIQPSIGTRKNRTDREQKLAESIEKKYPGYLDFVNRCVADLRNSDAFKNGVLFDLAEAFDGYDSDVYFDQVHLNEAGNRIVARNLATLIEASEVMTVTPGGR